MTYAYKFPAVAFYCQCFLQLSHYAKPSLWCSSELFGIINNARLLLWNKDMEMSIMWAAHVSITFVFLYKFFPLSCFANILWFSPRFTCAFIMVSLLLCTMLISVISALTLSVFSVCLSMPFHRHFERPWTWTAFLFFSFFFILFLSKVLPEPLVDFLPDFARYCVRVAVLLCWFNSWTEANRLCPLCPCSGPVPICFWPSCDRYDISGAAGHPIAMEDLNWTRLLLIISIWYR